MPSQLQLRNRFNNTIDERQPERKKYFAWIGHPDGTIDVPEKPGYVWIRTSDDKIKQAYCAGAIPLYNNPVRVAYTDEHENTLVILERDSERFPPTDSGDGSTFPGGSQLGPHHTQHEPGGGDEPYYSPRQLLSLGARPQATPNMTVYVEKGFYPYSSNFNWWPGGNSSDMTAQIPASAGQFLFRIVYINAVTNVLAYVNSSTSDDPLGFNYEALLALIPTNACPIAAIKLTNGMTSITESNVYDIRIIVDSSPGTVAAGGGSGVLWDNVIIVAGSGGDYTSISSALSAAVSGDLIFVAPGTYTANLTHKNGVYIRGMGQTGSVHVAPAAGIPLTLPASGGCVVENVTLDPPAGSVAISYPSASTCSLALREVEVGANGAASVGASTASASGILTAADCTFNGELSIKCVTTLYNCQVLGAITQAASAGALTIYGGRVVGNLSHVAGSTISLHELATILGTVSGAGTIIGAYLNSSGHIVFINGTAISGRANPSASIGLTAINGTATTVLASDSAPALSQAIAPTWSGQHQWSLSLFAPDGSNAAPAYSFTNDQDSGIYLSGADEVSVALGGVKKVSFVAGVNAASLSFLGIESIRYSSSSLVLRYGISSSVASHQWGTSTTANAMQLTSSDHLNLVTGDLQLNTTTRISNAGAATFTTVTASDGTDSKLTSNSQGDACLSLGTTTLVSNAVIDASSDQAFAGMYFSVYSAAAASNRPFISLRRSRGTQASTAIVLADDQLGSISFNGMDGTGGSFSQAVAIIALVDGTPGTSDMPGRLLLATTADGAAAAVERMRLDSKGNVIVNTAAIATGATDGFLYVPSCAGTPTGTPTTYTGRVPIVVDTTNNRWYFYSGGAWRNAGP